MNQDQKAAIAKYDEVMQNLEFARDLQNQFRNFLADEERQKKKQAKKEASERAKVETNRMALILVLQKLSAAFANNKVKEDFTKGENGAIKLSKEQLNHLEEFLKTMKISGSGNQNALDETDKNVVASAEHLLSLAEGKTKKFSGGKSTYKDVLDAFEAIKKSDYDFEQAPAAIAPPQNANNASPTSTSNSNKPTPKKQQPPVANQQPPMTNGNKAVTPVKETTPPVVPQPAGGVVQQAPVPPPNMAAPNPAVFPPAPHHMFQTPPTTQQPSINFLQESQIDMTSPDMDPAVVMVHHSAPPPPVTTAPPPFAVGELKFKADRYTVLKLRKFSLTFDFWQKCRENNGFTMLISRNIFHTTRTLYWWLVLHTVEKTEFYSHAYLAKISSKQRFY